MKSKVHFTRRSLNLALRSLASANTLQVIRHASLLRHSGKIGVELPNPDPSEGLSNSLPFNIYLRGWAQIPPI